jgi:tRNA 2-selenouridine synthase
MESPLLMVQALMVNEHLINLEEFLEARQCYSILDARSEREFSQSHIPQAVNLPILTDTEREIVGTLYKQQGSEKAILKGFELVGPRFHEIQKKAMALFPEKKILLYCWRGGMRSQIMSWLLGMVGFEVLRLKGGYKTYRSFTFETVRKPFAYLALGGKTGTGKTEILQALAAQGEQVLDLEGLAHHRGSSFGGIGQKKQPSVEQFENQLAEALLKLDPSKTIWVEDESRRIGSVILPDGFFHQLDLSPLVVITRTPEERIQHIKQLYASLPKEELAKAVTRLKSKLGGLRTTQALADIEEGKHEAWIQNMLLYYDKTYEFDLDKRIRKSSTLISLEGESVHSACKKLLNLKSQIIYGNPGDKTHPVE